MNTNELEVKLTEAGVRKDVYQLSGGLPNEAYCLAQSDEEWQVYYSERGSKSNLKTFDTESQACQYLFELLTGKL